MTEVTDHLTTKFIIVHKNGEEGMLLVDRKTGKVASASNEAPIWADGLLVAALASRTGWYEQRLGSHLPDELRSPRAINADDLDWVALDAEGDIVEIEAVMEYRTQMLGELLEIDLESDDLEQQIEGATAGALVDFTYQDQPNDEKTLAEAAGQDFGVIASTTSESQRTAQGGER